ncbi:16S rRNA (guanine(966)-N(2))-methyltransferase RsmD [Thermoanaerobacterium sp. DL9XJH110]|uniref:16S rRNA (guanine(966)-N(2))-methyltransferase RsmD n=1 Tax=Thermoanaerobacterium sp. DL9XJH110 TaxID=3386643 RepID=UPI003BB4E6D7
MRIIGGFYRGRKIKSPAGTDTRPTPDMVREALFNIISPVVADSVFLDIYAGTGAVGLEALSRGARFTAFIEKDAAACRLIKDNLANLGLRNKALVIKSDALEGLKKLEKNGLSFDIIFMDPPYHKNMTGCCLTHLINSGLIKAGGVVIVQHSEDEKVEQAGFCCIKKRRYGRTMLTFFTRE